MQFVPPAVVGSLRYEKCHTIMDVINENFMIYTVRSIPKEQRPIMIGTTGKMLFDPDSFDCSSRTDRNILHLYWNDVRVRLDLVTIAAVYKTVSCRETERQTAYEYEYVRSYSQPVK